MKRRRAVATLAALVGLLFGATTPAIAEVAVPPLPVVSEPGIDASPRIVGGVDTDITSTPWQVFLFQVADWSTGAGYSCGGSLINAWWIVTAAHCVTTDTDAVADPADVLIVAGKGNLRRLRNTDWRGVSSVIRHPDYVAATVTNDVALVQLTVPVAFNRRVRPITLPFDQDESAWPAHRTPVLISGWGLTSTGGDPSDILQSAVIRVKGDPLDDSRCGRWSWFDAFNTVNNLCAGYRYDGRDICQGDSGGPYAIRVDGVWTLAGITSYNSGRCGSRKWPGIASRVTTFDDWFVSPPPAGVAWTYSGSTATVTWSATGVGSATAVTGYRVEVSQDGGQSWSVVLNVAAGTFSVNHDCSVGQDCRYRVATLDSVNSATGPYRFATAP